MNLLEDDGAKRIGYAAGPSEAEVVQMEASRSIEEECFR
jgi:hypothetical protein